MIKSPLRTNRQVLTWLCVYTIEQNSAKWKKMCYVFCTVFIFLCNLLSFAVSWTFCIRNWSVNLENSLFSIIQIIGMINANYIIVITLFKRHEISGIFMSLENIYRECE